MTWGCKAKEDGCGWASRRTFTTGEQEWWCDTCERSGWIAASCHLPAPTAASQGALCVRERGHVGPGLFCTSDPEKAAARDVTDGDSDARQTTTSAPQRAALDGGGRGSDSRVQLSDRGTTAAQTGCRVADHGSAPSSVRPCSSADDCPADVHTAGCLAEAECACGSGLRPADCPCLPGGTS